MRASTQNFGPAVERFCSVGQRQVQALKVACHADLLDFISASKGLVDNTPLDGIRLLVVFEGPDVFSQFGAGAFGWVLEGSCVSVISFLEREARGSYIGFGVFCS